MLSQSSLHNLTLFSVSPDSTREVFDHGFRRMQSPVRSELVFGNEQGQSRGLPGTQEGVADEPLVAAPVLGGVVQTGSTHHKTTDVFSVMPHYIMGTRFHSDLKWGKDGDECVICMEPMTNEQEITDLPPCSHTYIPRMSHTANLEIEYQRNPLKSTLTSVENTSGFISSARLSGCKSRLTPA